MPPLRQALKSDFEAEGRSSYNNSLASVEAKVPSRVLFVCFVANAEEALSKRPALIIKCGSGRPSILFASVTLAQAMRHSF